MCVPGWWSRVGLMWFEDPSAPSLLTAAALRRVVSTRQYSPDEDLSPLVSNKFRNRVRHAWRLVEGENGAENKYSLLFPVI